MQRSLLQISVQETLSIESSLQRSLLAQISGTRLRIEISVHTSTIKVSCQEVSVQRSLDKRPLLESCVQRSLYEVSYQRSVPRDLPSRERERERVSCTEIFNRDLCMQRSLLQISVQETLS